MNKGGKETFEALGVHVVRPRVRDRMFCLGIASYLELLLVIEGTHAQDHAN